MKSHFIWTESDNWSELTWNITLSECKTKKKFTTKSILHKPQFFLFDSHEEDDDDDEDDASNNAEKSSFWSKALALLMNAPLSITQYDIKLIKGNITSLTIFYHLVL